MRATSARAHASTTKHAQRQDAIEQQAAEIVDLLARTGATDSQMSDVRQMAWLHLKLLAARASVIR